MTDIDWAQQLRDLADECAPGQHDPGPVIGPHNADDFRAAASAFDHLTRERDHLLEIWEQLFGQREGASQRGKA